MTGVPARSGSEPAVRGSRWSVPRGAGLVGTEGLPGARVGLGVHALPGPALGRGHASAR